MKLIYKFLLFGLFCGSANAQSTPPNSSISTSDALSGGKSFIDNPKNYLTGKLDSVLNGFATSSLKQYVETIEVTASGMTSEKPVFGLLVVKKLYESPDFLDNFFNQTSVFVHDDRKTVNFGLGYRRMSQDQKWLYGVNAFYDHEFPYDHQRSSLGLELRSSIVSFNANSYYAVSGWKEGRLGMAEKALSGNDAEVSVVLPYMPTSRVFYKKFIWNTTGDVPDIKGANYGVRMNGSLLPGLGVEVGRYNYTNQKDSTFIRLSYDLLADPRKQQSLFSDQAFKFTSMKDKRFEKVQRENLIVKQTRARVIFRGS